MAAIIAVDAAGGWSKSVSVIIIPVIPIEMATVIMAGMDSPFVVMASGYIHISKKKNAVPIKAPNKWPITQLRGDDMGLDGA